MITPTTKSVERNWRWFSNFMLIIMVIWTLTPFYWMFATSIKKHKEIYGRDVTLWPTDPTMDSYRTIFFDTEYMTFFWNSIIVAMNVTAITLVCSTLAAYAIARLEFPGRRIMARAMIYTYLMPQSLLFIPLLSILLMVGLNNSLFGLSLAHLGFTIPFCTWLLIGFFQSVPVEVEEAAGVALATPMILGTAWAAREQKLVYWHLPTFTKIADEVIRENFEEFRKSAGLSDSEAAFVKISGKDFIPQINAGLETGNLPDVVWLNESLIQLYRSQGRMMDVTDIVDDMKGFEGGIFETSLAAVTHGGKAWGVPYALNPWPMHARVDVLEKHGLDYPRTWEAFVETCKIVQDKPFYGFGLDLGLNTDASQNIMQILWCHGGFTADDNGTAAFNNAGNIAGFDFINSMYNDAGIIPRGVVGNSESSWNNKMYQAGQVAFVNNPTSIYAHLVSNDPELQAKTGLFSVPAGPAGAFNQIDTWSTGIFNTAPEPELAKGLVKAMMDPAKYNEVITKTNGRWVPVYPKLFEDPWWTSRPQYGEFSNIAKTGVPVSYKGQPSPGMGEVLSTNLVPEALQTVLVDGVPAADAVAKVADKIAAIFERANG